MLDLQPKDHPVQLIYFAAHFIHHAVELPPLASPRVPVVRRRPLCRPRHPLVVLLHVLEGTPEALRSFPQPHVPGADPPGQQPHPFGQEPALVVRVLGLTLERLKISTTAISNHASIFPQRARSRTGRD
ncbi:hypothetical protein ABZ400_29910 [Streptomyces sp. NPDC005897]|uniref:hypothetical protein n=1 Tax=Streptomyces sp. NPDC005897 TaxID=3157081 RepID=UPI0033D7AF4A